MDIGRIVKHLLTSAGQVRRAFPDKTMDAIEAATRASESAHVGELRFVVEGALDGAPLWAGQSARERALDVFAQTRMWDTEYNNGVLIYLLLADRDVEIVADRAIHAKVGTAGWEAICSKMEAAFRKGDFEGGVIAGIGEITAHLVQHFPATAGATNELPDRPLSM